MEQEPLVVRERGGLDLVAQAFQRVAMNAREQAALAPFLGRSHTAGLRRELAAHGTALLLERRERGQNLVGG